MTKHLDNPENATCDNNMLPVVNFRTDLKDYELAKIIFGTNKKRECKIVQDLKKRGLFKKICDGWYVIRDSKLIDDLGWIVPSECLLV